ncbi:hypothetical protein QYF36_004617 [Acer negundo]|nr:hypothetical protein QYF36_004617 [Acer negundo]
MAKARTPATMPILILAMVFIMITQANALMPYTRPLYDIIFPSEDPFRILEQTPLTIPKNLETIALARSDWKETATAHVISLDIPGLKIDDIKIEVEENRVLRVSGERKSEEEVEGEKWHRAERTCGKFWRQFRLPMNADLDHINAHHENGVLKITVPKFGDQEKKRQPKVINIAQEGSSGENIKAIKADM